jgi:sulfur carrier protein
LRCRIIDQLVSSGNRPERKPNASARCKPHAPAAAQIEPLCAGQRALTLQAGKIVEEPADTMASSARAATTTLSLRVNGQSIRSSAASLADLLAELGYGEAKVATARNGDFVAERARANTQLASGDSIEIVAPRQGG